MMDKTIDWLLAAEPWVQYRTRLDLLGQSDGDPEVRSTRAAMLAMPCIQTLVAELADWPGPAIRSHKKADLLLHKLALLAELGLTIDDPSIKPIIEKVLTHQALDGPFQVRINIPPAFGGDGSDHYTWVLTNAPTVVYSLLRFGLGEDERVQRAVEYLKNLGRENGWGCVSAPDLGKFRGPGRKEDPCPYATLIMLKALATIPQFLDSQETRNGVETLLQLWQNRRERHPYMFYMGTDFCKLKFPFVWYDLLHVLEVLTRFPWLRDDPRLVEMLGILRSKADGKGRFSAESIWTAYQGWDFAKKREPSPGITLFALRILQHSTRQ